MISTDELAMLPFAEAAEAWLETRKLFVAEKTTLRDYKIYARTLGKFFQEMRLNEITADQIRAYQQVRMASAIWTSINKPSAFTARNSILPGIKRLAKPRG